MGLATGDLTVHLSPEQEAQSGLITNHGWQVKT